MTPVQQEAALFHRCADLAVAILGSLRKPGRAAGYSSGRQVREWLTADGVKFTQAEVGSALSLLEAVGLLERSAPAFGQPALDG